MLELELSALHGALRDPVMQSLTFLNEIMERFPDAISFAPGAPNPEFFRNLAPGVSMARWVEHLRTSRKLDNGAVEQLLYGYGPTRGLINDLVAAALRRDAGIDVPDDAVVITVGAQEAMFLLLLVLCPSPGDAVAAADPCYVGFAGAARTLNVPVVPIRETDAGPDLDELEIAYRQATAAGCRIRALYVAPDFANPSGAVIDIASRRRLLDIAKRERMVVIEDGTYAFTSEVGAERPSLKALDQSRNVVHVGTFAKICMPGARVGYVVADQPVRGPRDEHWGSLADALVAVKSMVTLNTPPIAQAVIGGMLLAADGSIDALGRDKGERYRGNLEVLLAALDRHLATLAESGAVSWNRPGGGFFVRMRLPVPANAALLELAASKFGVLWTPMVSFHLASTSSNEVRLSHSYLKPDEIEQGVERFAAFVKSIAW